MLRGVAHRIFGKFESWDELKKFGILGTLFGLIIGAYWAIRPIKDSIFFNVVGGDYQPMAKIVSLCVVVPLVIIYGKLFDYFPRHKVFYGLTLLYGVLGLVFAWFLADPVYGLPNVQADPSRLIGWIWYVYVESFGSLVVALFWSIATDTTMPEVAKRGFPLIAMLGQFGNIVGPKYLRASTFGFANSAPVVALAGGLMICMCLLMWLFMHVVPSSQLQGYQGAETKKEEKPGFLDGLKLLLTKPYLFGIFLIITFFEVIVTIFDFHFKSLAKAAFPLEKDMATYLADYAVWTGIVAFLCVLLGINNIQRKLGMTASLILMPVLVAGAVLLLKLNASALTVSFWIMVVAKAVNYALNQPTLKQAYIPTTRDAKYKSQAWIEMFGSRGSKAAGSAVNNMRKVFKVKYGPANGVAWFLSISSVISFGLIGLWLVAAIYVSRTYTKAVKNNEVVC